LSLDINHNGSLSIQEASKDVTFQSIIGGNISLILTENLLVICIIEKLDTFSVSLKPNIVSTWILSSESLGMSILICDVFCFGSKY
jgi:hypothetical protein